MTNLWRCLIPCFIFSFITGCGGGTGESFNETNNEPKEFIVEKKDNCVQLECPIFIFDSVSNNSENEVISFGLRSQFVDLVAAQGIRVVLMFSNTSDNIGTLGYTTSLPGSMTCKNHSQSVICLWMNDDSLRNIYFEDVNVFEIVIPKSQKSEFGTPVTITFTIDGGPEGEYGYSSKTFIY